MSSSDYSSEWFYGKAKICPRSTLKLGVLPEDEDLSLNSAVDSSSSSSSPNGPFLKMDAVVWPILGPRSKLKLEAS